MPDARIIIEGRVASDPRFGQAQSGKPVGNLRILAGRSRKDEQGQWQTLSTTAYEAAFWEAHHDLMAGLGAQKGDSVVVTGTVSGVESYQGQNGESLTVKVNADGLRVFPKQQQGGGQQGQGAPYGQQQGYVGQGQAQRGYGPQGGQHHGWTGALNSTTTTEGRPPMRQTFTMTVPLDLTVSSNRTAQTWKRNKVKNEMRALTRVHGRHLIPCGTASVYVGLVKRTAGLYDPSNTSDTWKGLADELVDMGVVDADDWQHMLGPIPYHHGIDKTIPQGYFRAVVTLTEYVPVPAAVSA